MISDYCSSVVKATLIVMGFDTVVFVNKNFTNVTMSNNTEIHHYYIKIKGVNVRK